ncbi:MAG: hypothetical protein CVU41_08785 [Chloroflexi bacterium HGW-Chloroflexi-3]|nr:MAG: hypothetical protein CVU41_08785 [Chloroflexi bacterium HGW-Chloroflexi-3]
MRFGLYLDESIFHWESQKGIIINRQGSMINEMGKTAKKEIEGLKWGIMDLYLRFSLHLNWRNYPDEYNLMRLVQEDS